MAGKLKDQIEYTMLCIAKFAKAASMSPRQACRFLYDYKGLDFLDKSYEVESTFSPRVVVEDLMAVCRNNGGAFAWSRNE